MLELPGLGVVLRTQIVAYRGSRPDLCACEGSGLAEKDTGRNSWNKQDWRLP